MDSSKAGISSPLPKMKVQCLVLYVLMNGSLCPGTIPHICTITCKKRKFNIKQRVIYIWIHKQATATPDCHYSTVIIPLNYYTLLAKLYIIF